MGTAPVGLSSVAPRALPSAGLGLAPAVLALVALGLEAGSIAAQDPPDTTQVIDSTAVVDSLATPGEQEADTISADTIFYNLPAIRNGLSPGYETGVWSWDRDAIMASGANTLAELFARVPGLIALQGGDYGTPQAMTAFGQGGAGYRIFRDGFEVYPVDGGVADLQRIGLVGVEHVRLDRSMGQMVVEMRTHRHDDGRTFSVVEAGTGDLDTNMFRGVYADPSALLGSMAVGLERIDTRGRGPTRDEGGNRTGSWVRYQYHLQDRAGIAFDYRRVGSQTRVPEYMSSTTRTDLTVRASWRPVDGVVLEGATGKSSLDVPPPIDGEHTRVGGSRRQHAGRIGLELGSLWANGSVRSFEGGLPSHRIDASGGLTSARWGGVSGRVAKASWKGTGTTNLGVRAWGRPIPWVTLFGAYETGEYGGRSGPLEDGPPRPPLAWDGGAPGTEAITERETLRVGGSFSGWGVMLGGASLYARSDEVLPLGTELDGGAVAAPGAHRNGYEATAVLPTPWEGLTIEGSYQWWDEDGPYLPKQIYRGSFEFHRIYKESGNLEFWASFGVRGHDPMLAFVGDDGAGVPGVVRVPFYQNWYTHVQVRVVTVRLWLGMDNFTFRRNLQSYPERLMPYGRSFFALRWDMWN